MKPMFRRLFVFSITRASKYKGSSLFKTKENDGFLSTAQPAWVVSAADDCKFWNFKRGEKVWVHDGFELTDTNLDLWSEYANDPAFTQMAKEVEDCGGTVSTMVVSEGSVLAVELPDES